MASIATVLGHPLAAQESVKLSARRANALHAKVAQHVKGNERSATRPTSAPGRGNAVLARSQSVLGLGMSELRPRAGGAHRPRVRCSAAATSAPPEEPKQEAAGAMAAAAAWLGALRNAVALWMLNAYLNFASDGGIKLLVSFFPSKIKKVFADLYQCYKEQVALSFDGDMRAATRRTVAVFAEMIRVYAKEILGTPFQFQTNHQAIREPYDYYKLGNEYVGCLVNFDRSVLGHRERWDEVQRKLDAGENVVFLANHQSEADAAFIPLLTEKSHPGLGERVTYVAGGRVVGDLMAKPFSMGRNLLLVHSKKHMQAETRKEQMRDNMRAIKAMDKLFRAGGLCLWIAPSGGRDRMDAETGVLSPDPFDPDVVEMVRKAGTRKGMPATHYYPLAMATYDVMPPPSSVGGALGEERKVAYTGVGLSLGEAVDVSGDDKKALADEVFASVCEQYDIIKGCMGYGTPFEKPAVCERPWLDADDK